MDAYLFDPASSSFTFVLGSMSGARLNFASAHLPSDDLLIVGGDTGDTTEIFHRP